MSNNKIIQFPNKQSKESISPTKQYVIDYLTDIAVDVYKQIGSEGYAVEATHTNIQDFINGYIDSGLSLATTELQLYNVKYPQNFEQFIEAVGIAYIEASKQDKNVSVAYTFGFVYYAVYICED